MIEGTELVKITTGLPRSHSFGTFGDHGFSLQEKSPLTRKQEVVQEVSFEDTLPKAAMTLKETAAIFGMYLTFDDRSRLFDELDFLLDPDGWDEDDNMPQKASFMNFLRWLVATNRHDWTSLGLDGNGNTSVAFANGSNVITALFLAAGTVQWTSNISTEDGLDLAAGQSPLRAFARNSQGLLEQL